MESRAFLTVNRHATMNTFKTMKDLAPNLQSPSREAAASPTNGSAPELSPDQELVYRLKAAIDQRGRYAFRLNDMAAGYAAAQGISNAAARSAIEERFTQALGKSPQEYLDRHYDERRKLDQAPERTPGRGR